MALLRVFCTSCVVSATVAVDETADITTKCPKCGTIIAAIAPLGGCVYVLSNPSIPGLVKIGKTHRQVDSRVAELNSSTGVPAPFQVEAYFFCGDPDASENAAHMSLAACRVEGKEFFRCSPQTAVEKLSEILQIRPAYARVPSSAAVKQPPPVPSTNGILNYLEGLHEIRCATCGTKQWVDPKNTLRVRCGACARLFPARPSNSL